MALVWGVPMYFVCWYLCPSVPIWKTVTITAESSVIFAVLVETTDWIIRRRRSRFRSNPGSFEGGVRRRSRTSCNEPFEQERGSRQS